MRTRRASRSRIWSTPIASSAISWPIWIRSGGVRGLHVAQLADNAFANYVVDRLRSPQGEQRIYLRPKVPFGAAR